MDLSNIIEITDIQKFNPENSSYTFSDEELNDKNLFIYQVSNEFKRTIENKTINTSKENFFKCTFGYKNISIDIQKEYLTSKNSILCKGCYRANLNDVRSYQKDKKITCIGLILRKLNNR